MRIRQETVERHIVEGTNEEKQAVMFQRYIGGEWRCMSLGPKPTDSPGRFSPAEFRAVFERVIEEKVVVS